MNSAFSQNARHCIDHGCALQMSYLLQLATKQEDAICLELYVKENSMPQMVLAIGTAANHKELLRTSEGILSQNTDSEYSAQWSKPVNHLYSGFLDICKHH